jgi:hypothetical protein
MSPPRKEAFAMTIREAMRRAERLGLSAWIAQASAVGGDSAEIIEVKCVGFGRLELPLGEGETWEEAFARAMKLIFSP